MSSRAQVNRGSKRRIRNIRWKRSEVVSLILLLLIASIISVVIALWFEANHGRMVD